MVGAHAHDNYALKRGITLDLKHPEAQAVLARMAAKADVLIESFLPETAARLGLAHDKLQSLNPRLLIRPSLS